MNRRIRILRPSVTVLACAVAIGAAAGCGGDECVAGQSQCDGQEVLVCIHECSDIVCRDHWQGTDVCLGDRVCIVPPGRQAMCVESTEPDPLCAGEATSSHCVGDAVASCVAGFRAKSVACGATDEAHEPLLPGGVGATHCIEPSPNAATCVPPQSVTDPLCAGTAGPQCAGAVLVQCVDGLAVAKTACASCAVDPAPLNPRGQCHGFLGDGCVSDRDCASGLSCLADSRGLLLCTASCDGVMSTPAETFPTPSPSCIDTFRAGGPPPSGYVTAPVPGNVLACVAARCEWLSR